MDWTPEAMKVARSLPTKQLYEAHGFSRRGLCMETNSRRPLMSGFRISESLGLPVAVWVWGGRHLIVDGANYPH